MRRIAALAIVVFAIIAIAVAATPFLVSGDFLKERVATAINNLTGRTVTLSGDANLAIYPRLTVTLEGLTVGNPPSMGDDPFIAAEGVRASLRVLPLLFGRVEFDDFELIGPRIHLVVTREGANWRLAGGSLVTQATASAAPGESAPPVAEIPIGRLIISGGTILYDDRLTAQREEMTAVEIDARWPSAESALSGRGAMQWRGEPVEFTGVLARPLEIMRGNASPARFAIASTPLRATFTGNMTNPDAFALEGTADVSTPSLRRAIEWLATPMGVGPILGAASIRGHATWTQGTISFDTATVELDGNTAEGALALDLAGERPVVTGTLASERLDLSPYVEAIRADLVANGPWITAPAWVPVVEVLDADLRFSAGEVLFGTSGIGKTAASVTLKGGGLSIAVGEVEVAGGTLRASIAAQRQGELFSARARIALTDIGIRPLLMQFAGIAALEGTADLTLDLTSRARFWGGFAAGISGSGEIAVASGSITGFNMQQIAEAFRDRLAAPVVASDVTTAFSHLGATLTVDRSRLITSDLTMVGDGYSLTLKGNGAVMTGVVEAMAELKQAADSILLAISGTWSAPIVGRAGTTDGGAFDAPVADPT